MSEEKMKIWSSVCETDAKMTKDGYGGITAINHTYQVKMATQLWGPQGGAWGLRELQFERFDVKDEVVLLLRAILYYPSGEIEMAHAVKLLVKSKRGLNLDTDAYKKVRTGCMSKALSELGFNADVFQGRFDDNKYVKAVQEKKDLLTKQELGEQLKEIGSTKELKEFWVLHPEIHNSQPLRAVFTARQNELDPEARKKKVAAAIAAIKKEISAAKNKNNLAAIYKHNRELVDADDALLELFKKRKKQIDE